MRCRATFKTCREQAVNNGSWARRLGVRCVPTSRPQHGGDDQQQADRSRAPRRRTGRLTIPGTRARFSRNSGVDPKFQLLLPEMFPSFPGLKRAQPLHVKVDFAKCRLADIERLALRQNPPGGQGADDDQDHPADEQQSLPDVPIGRGSSAPGVDDAVQACAVRAAWAPAAIVRSWQARVSPACD